MKNDEEKSKAYTFDFKGNFMPIKPIPGNKLPQGDELHYQIVNPEDDDTSKKKKRKPKLKTQGSQRSTLNVEKLFHNTDRSDSEF